MFTEVDVDSEHPVHDDAASEWGLSIIRQIACSPAKKKETSIKYWHEKELTRENYGCP